jgi:hypothetical protein
MSADDFLRALGVSPETLERMHKVDAPIAEPTEEDVAGCVWAVDLSIADDWMIPPGFERLNGVAVPRPSIPFEDGYRLAPSRVKRGTASLSLTIEEAQAARARFILWHTYYVRAYHAGRLSYVEQDAARRLYWKGNPPPVDPERWLVNSEIRRAIQKTLGAN